MKYRYRLSQSIATSTPLLKDIEFENEWLKISDGAVLVKAGYAWDGCSPAWKIPLTRHWLGVYDGPLLEDGRPATWRASLFHDALCQFRHEIGGLMRDNVTQVFADEIQDAPKWMRALYPKFINWFGPQDF